MVGLRRQISSGDFVEDIFIAQCKWFSAHTVAENSPDLNICSDTF